MSSRTRIERRIARDLATSVWGLGDVLATHTLPAGTTVEAARGWAEAYMRDHFGTAVTAHLEKDASIRLTVFEVLVPDV